MEKIVDKTTEIPGFWHIIWRGITGRCPNCGKGRLFKSYLKHVDNCSVCGEKFSHIRADDGPAWLTIIIVGHIFALILTFAPSTGWSDRVLISVWCSFAIVSALAILPLTKGLFIGIIWRMRRLEASK